MTTNFDNVSQTVYVFMNFFLTEPLVYIVSACNIFATLQYSGIWSQVENNTRGVS